MGRKTPFLLVALTLIFLLASVTLLFYVIYSIEVAEAGQPISITVLVALLVCLIPTKIGGLYPRSASPASAAGFRKT